MTDIFVVIYLDDILIFSNSWKIISPRPTRLGTFAQVRSALKPKKCLFHTQKIEFLGFMSLHWHLMDTAKTDAVSIWPTLTNLKAVQAFQASPTSIADSLLGSLTLSSPHSSHPQGHSFFWVLITQRHSEPSTCLHHGTILAHSTLIIQLLLKLMLLICIAAIISQISPDDVTSIDRVLLLQYAAS